MAEKKAISAREVVADIKVGMTDEQLMAKHMLSAKGLQSLKNKLIAAGLITQAQLDRKAGPTTVTPQVDKKALARSIADGVKAGLPDSEIVKRFRIPADKLTSVYDSLIKAGYITLDDLAKRPGRFEETVDLVETAKLPEPPVPPQKETSQSAETTKNVLRDIGKQFMEGMAQGLEDSKKPLEPPAGQQQPETEAPGIGTLDDKSAGICVFAALITGIAFAQGATTSWLWFIVGIVIFGVIAFIGYYAFLERYRDKVKYVVIAGILCGLGFIGNIGKEGTTSPGSSAQKDPTIEITLTTSHTVKGAASEIGKEIWGAASRYDKAETLLVKVKMSSSGLSDKYGNRIREDLPMGQFKLDSKELAEIRLYKDEVSYAWEDSNLIAHIALLRNMENSYLLKK